MVLNRKKIRNNIFEKSWFFLTEGKEPTATNAPKRFYTNGCRRFVGQRFVSNSDKFVTSAAFGLDI